MLNCKLRVIKIDSQNPEKDLILIGAKVIEEGGVIIYPTDTVYGIGCSLNVGSVARVFEIKKRDMKNPLSVAFSDIEMVKRYAFLDYEKEKFIREHIAEPYTFIVKKRENIPDIVTSKKKGVGVRIPNSRITRELIRCVGAPIITTSANIAGEIAPGCVDEINREITTRVDLIIDGGACGIGVASRIIDLESGRIIRELEGPGNIQ